MINTWGLLPGCGREEKTMKNVYKQQPPAKSGTILVAAAVVVTAILVPLVTAWAARVFGRPADLPEDESAPAPDAAERI